MITSVILSPKWPENANIACPRLTVSRDGSESSVGPASSGRGLEGKEGATTSLQANANTARLPRIDELIYQKDSKRAIKINT